MIEFLDYLMQGSLAVLVGICLIALGIGVWKLFGNAIREKLFPRTEIRIVKKRFYWLDAAILVALAAPMFVILQLGRPTIWGMEIPKHLALTYPLIAAAALVLIALCALKFNSTFACVLLAAATVVGAYVTPEQPTDKKPQAAAPTSNLAVRKKLDRIRIQLVDPNENAELTISGVPFGKLPCETTFKELLEKIPKDYSQNYRERKLKRSKAKLDAKASGYLEETIPGVVSFNEIGISFAQRFSQYAQENSLPPNSLNDYHQVYFSVSVGNTPGYIRWNDKRQRLDAEGVFQVFLDLRFEESASKFDRLIKRLQMADYEPTSEWLDALAIFGRQGMADLKKLGISDKEMLPVYNSAIKHRFGISDSLNADEAWAILERIREQVGTTDKLRSAALKHLAPYLDPQQVVDEVLANIGSRPEREYFRSLSDLEKDIKVRDSLNALKHVAKVIDRNLNHEDREHYNIFERQIGDAWFAKNLREPPNYSLNDVLRLARQLKNGGEPLSPEMKSRLTYGYRPSYRSYRPPFGSRMADEFVVSQLSTKYPKAISREYGDNHSISNLASKVGLTLPLGEPEWLGSVEISKWQRRLLFLDSPVGRKYRRENQQEVLDLAIRSIGPLPEMVQKQETSRRFTRTPRPALEALYNKYFTPFSNKFSVRDLEFLFLDSKTQINVGTPSGETVAPSLAMKFWPHIDLAIEKNDKIHSRFALNARWLYLARIWPESGPEMFVETYFKTKTSERQPIIAERFYGGLPNTLPVESRLEIYKMLLERAKHLPVDGKAPSFALWPENLSRPINELESIKYAISHLDCPEGAKAFTEIWAEQMGSTDLEKLRAADSTLIQRLESNLTCYKGNWLIRYPSDARINAFAKHENPVLRQIAIALVRERPTPQLTDLLDLLVLDEDDDVKSFALEVKKELEELLAAPLPSLDFD